MKNYEEIKNYLLNHVDEIGNIISDINSIDGSLDYLEYYENNEEFFNTFFYNNPSEAVRSSFYGDYHYSDNWVKFDGYGNLKSVNDYELEKEYQYYIDEIVNGLLEHYQEMILCDNELIKLIEEVK